jgi:hypothetical protein
VVEILRERRSRDPESAGAVFPDSVGGHRDPNNVERDHRRVRQGTGFEWVVPHTYRKTVATRLDRRGLSARTIADQLGHSRISMTQDVYMGRRAVDKAAAAALEGVSPRPETADEVPPIALWAGSDRPGPSGSVTASLQPSGWECARLTRNEALTRCFVGPVGLEPTTRGNLSGARGQPSDGLFEVD